MSKYYWKMVVKRGEVEKILEELQGKCKQVSGADPAGCHNEK